MLSRPKLIKPQAAQRSLVILEKIYPKSINNHRSVAMDICGDIDINLFQQALHATVERHEMLRAVLINNESKENNYALNIKPIHQCDSWLLSYLEIKNAKTTATLENFNETLTHLNQANFIEEPFDIYEGPLWRALLIKMAENNYQFAMIFNHIIVDETSIGIILTDISRYYNDLLNGKKADPKQPPLLSLSNQSFQLSEEETKTRVAHWEKELTDLNNISLQTDTFKPFNFKGDRLSFHLNKDLISDLTETFKHYSLNQILLTALYSLLFRYTGETDICLGMTSSNRRHATINHEEMLKLVNCFFNSVPLRLRFSADASFDSLLPQVRTAVSSTLKMQLPLDIIFHDALSRDSKASLCTASPFNIMLVFNDIKPRLTLEGATASYPVEINLKRSKFFYFGLNVDLYPDHSCTCFIEYNTDLFHQDTIQRFIKHFTQVLNTVAHDPHCEISKIPLLLDEEKKLIEKLNDSKQGTKEYLVPEFFHQQALKNTIDTFLVFHKQDGQKIELTYQDFDSLTNQFAHCLINKYNLTSNTKVGISLTRSPELLIALFAVLKAGGIIVPMETESCTMLSHKLENNDCQLIVVDQLTALLFHKQDNLIKLDDIKIDIENSDKSYPHVDISPMQPAYIMYTSGTSGAKPSPKGVIVSHQGFANLLYGIMDINLRPYTKIIGTALPVFDAFLFDVLVAMAAKKGQFHVCFEEGRFSPFVLEKIIREEDITFGVFLPHLLEELDTQLPLLDIISMGATPNKDSLEKWYTANINRRIWNGYGPTETTVCLTLSPYLPGNDHRLIGYPIRNMQVFILNTTNPKHLSLCPIGLPGEIYVAGPGVSLGYLNNEKLNHDKFPTLWFNSHDNTFKRIEECERGSEIVNQTKTEMRLYATGDKACYQLTNNNQLNIKYLGRTDRQVKIQGVRVELDDLEAVLKELPLINNIVIIPTENNNTLIAYVIPKNHLTSLKEIKKHIRELLNTLPLPKVVHPRTIVSIPQFEYNQNGKINLRALPIPDISHANSVLLTPLQHKISAIWADLLAVHQDSIDIHATFEEMGGDSLLAAKLATPMAKLGLQGFYTFKNMTILELSQKIKADASQEIKPFSNLVDPKIVFFTRRPPITTPITPANLIETKKNCVVESGVKK